MPQTAPYGTWSSPITAEAITGVSTSLYDVLIDPVTSIVYHLEGRPAEEGRTALVETKSGRDIIGRGFSAATGVHEYGGGAATVYDGKAYFSNFKDGRIYEVDVEEGEPKPITPKGTAYRFACLEVYPKNKEFLVAVLEDHTNDGPSAVTNTLCLVDIVNSKVITNLVSGVDFYALPKFSPDGNHLAWVQWSHPDMPWEGSTVYIADVVASANDLHIENIAIIAGEPGKVSAGYVSWASKDTLLFLCDASGFSNPWNHTKGEAYPILPEPISEDFSEPMWNLSMFMYAVLDEEGSKAVFASYRNGRTVFNLIDLNTGVKQDIQSPYVIVDHLRMVSRSEHRFAFVGQKIDEGQSIVQCVISDLSSSSPTVSFTTVRPSSNAGQFDSGMVSKPQGISLQIAHNDDIHVVYYPPQNHVYTGSSIDGEKPPCIVSAHGGPTGLAYQGLRWPIQYFTSRGFAWLDVNYGGSYGYGRVYRDRLVGQWGIVDVEDCVKATELMSSQPYNFIDPKRAVIRGGSAGGFTTLATLCHSSGRKSFAAGTSFYGVTDLKAFTETTHKFESRYLFKLLGGTYEVVPKNYVDRSPINHIENLESPLLILQGDIDKVVPKEQAEAIYDRIKDKGGIVEYKLYEGEGHGFRQKDHQKDALERELAFYERALGLKGA
ncbi:alpha/beta-hydrolase [Marasmius fiardii PR-910]|nr:alpha/beta-hydrolase [Marasmius fiardii PR-910]